MFLLSGYGFVPVSICSEHLCAHRVFDPHSHCGSISGNCPWGYSHYGDQPSSGSLVCGPDYCSAADRWKPDLSQDCWELGRPSGDMGHDGCHSWRKPNGDFRDAGFCAPFLGALRPAPGECKYPVGQKDIKEEAL